VELGAKVLSVPISMEEVSVLLVGAIVAEGGKYVVDSSGIMSAIGQQWY
jgi:hypothetical protein